MVKRSNNKRVLELENKRKKLGPSGETEGREDAGGISCSPSKGLPWVFFLRCFPHFSNLSLDL